MIINGIVPSNWLDISIKLHKKLEIEWKRKMLSIFIMLHVYLL